MRSVALLLIGCLLCSCATMTRGRDEVISVESNPSGANATVSCAGNISATGTTPARLTISRKAEGCHVNIAKSGMKTKVIELDHGVNASYWMNFVVLGGVPLSLAMGLNGDPPNTTTRAWLGVGLLGAAGFVIDRATGAMYDHNPNVINVTLQPEQ
jgi:hypothetical protein